MLPPSPRARLTRVHRTQEVAAAMHRGLLLSDAERHARHAALYQVVTTHTSHTWAATLVKQLAYRLNSDEAAPHAYY